MRADTLPSSTEVGHVGDSVLRPPGDDAWDYVRPYANLKPHIFFKPIGSGVYESVYLPSHPALMVSNSDDPPGSFHSRDLFTPHPTIENAWKYVARDDDRITLMSGEKILPLAMEGCVRECPIARDALMVGNGRLAPGMLVFRADAADGMTDDEYVKAIWPFVERANVIADEFARITPDMVLPIPSCVDYPATDKKNIIRAQANRVFADRVDELYRRQLADGEKAKNLALDVPGLEKFILELVRNQAGIEIPDTKVDFFAAGIDSLRAAQIRRLLLKNLDLGGKDLPTNVVYDAGNVSKLAKLLYELRTGEKLTNGSAQEGDQIAVMGDLIAQYGKFEKRVPFPEREVVVGVSLHQFCVPSNEPSLISCLPDSYRRNRRPRCPPPSPTPPQSSRRSRLRPCPRDRRLGAACRLPRRARPARLQQDGAAEADGAVHLQPRRDKSRAERIHFRHPPGDHHARPARRVARQLQPVAGVVRAPPRRPAQSAHSRAARALREPRARALRQLHLHRLLPARARRRAGGADAGPERRRCHGLRPLQAGGRAAL